MKGEEKGRNEVLKWPGEILKLFYFIRALLMMDDQMIMAKAMGQMEMR